MYVEKLLFSSVISRISGRWNGKARQKITQYIICWYIKKKKKTPYRWPLFRICILLILFIYRFLGRANTLCTCGVMVSVRRAICSSKSLWLFEILKPGFVFSSNPGFFVWNIHAFRTVLLQNRPYIFLRHNQPTGGNSYCIIGQILH